MSVEVEVYGFVSLVVSFFALIVYLIWALVPDSVLKSVSSSLVTSVVFEVFTRFECSF